MRPGGNLVCGCTGLARCRRFSLLRRQSDRLAIKHVNRRLELQVFFLIGRHIRRRACGFLTLALTGQVAAQGGLRRSTACLGLQFLRQFLLDLDIRLDALGLDRGVRWRVIARRCQANGAFRSERNDGLNRTLAKRPGAENGRPFVILQSACNDFGSRCRAAIDQDNDFLAIAQVAIGRR